MTFRNYITESAIPKELLQAFKYFNQEKTCNFTFNNISGALFNPYNGDPSWTGMYNRSNEQIRPYCVGNDKALALYIAPDIKKVKAILYSGISSDLEIVAEYEFTIPSWNKFVSKNLSDGFYINAILGKTYAKIVKVEPILDKTGHNGNFTSICKIIFSNGSKINVQASNNANIEGIIIGTIKRFQAFKADKLFKEAFPDIFSNHDYTFDEFESQWNKLKWVEISKDSQNIPSSSYVSGKRITTCRKANISKLIKEFGDKLDSYIKKKTSNFEINKNNITVCSTNDEWLD